MAAEATERERLLRYPWSLVAGVAIEVGSLAIELRRLRNRIGSGDPLFGDDYEAGEPALAEAVKSGFSSLTRPLPHPWSEARALAS